MSRQGNSRRAGGGMDCEGDGIMTGERTVRLDGASYLWYGNLPVCPVWGGWVQDIEFKKYRKIKPKRNRCSRLEEIKC